MLWHTADDDDRLGGMTVVDRVREDTKSVLVLNVTYEPLSVIRVSRAVTLLMLDKAETIEGTGSLFSSMNEMIEVPSVIRLNHMINAPRQRPVPLSRKALFGRDSFTCQYCGDRPQKLEVEHVIPRSKGGKNIWENVVTACRLCNGRKADRTPDEAGMMLRRKPFAPTRLAMIASRGIESWTKYLAQ